MALFSAFLKRAQEESHQSLSDQPALIIPNVAIHDGDVPAAADDARFGFYDSSFNSFQIIYLHFYGSDARAARARHVAREAAGRVRKRGQDSAVDNAVDLHVTLIHVHAEDDAARLGFGKDEAELLGGVGRAEALFELLGSEVDERFRWARHIIGQSGLHPGERMRR